MASPRKRRLAPVSSPDDAFRVGVDSLDEDFLECRDLRHYWRVTSDYRRVTTEEDGIRSRHGHHDYVERRLTCARCHTERHEAYLVVNSPGWSALRSLGVTYHYPEGFLLKGVPAGVGNAAEVIRGLRYARTLGGANTGRRRGRAS